MRSRIAEANQVRGGAPLQVRSMQIKGKLTESSAKSVVCKLEANSLSSGSYSGEGRSQARCQSRGASPQDCQVKGVGLIRTRGGTMQMRVAVP